MASGLYDFVPATLPRFRSAVVFDSGGNGVTVQVRQQARAIRKSDGKAVCNDIGADTHAFEYYMIAAFGDDGKLAGLLIRDDTLWDRCIWEHISPPAHMLPRAPPPHPAGGHLHHLPLGVARAPAAASPSGAPSWWATAEQHRRTTQRFWSNFGRLFPLDPVRKVTDADISSVLTDAFAATMDVCGNSAHSQQFVSEDNTGRAALMFGMLRNVSILDCFYTASGGRAYPAGTTFGFGKISCVDAVDTESEGAIIYTSCQAESYVAKASGERVCTDPGKQTHTYMWTSRWTFGKDNKATSMELWDDLLWVDCMLTELWKDSAQAAGKAALQPDRGAGESYAVAGAGLAAAVLAAFAVARRRVGHAAAPLQAGGADCGSYGTV